MIPFDHFHVNPNGTAWVACPNEIEHDSDPDWLRLAFWHGSDRVCDTCDGTKRVHCPGPSTHPKTQKQRNAAGLVLGKDYCYGMHMGHDCPDCIGGRHTFDIEYATQAAPTAYDVKRVRVSIVPGTVLPILDNDAPEWCDRHDHHIGIGVDECAEYNGRLEGDKQPRFVRDITLPPAAAPDMTAVLVNLAPKGSAS